MAAPQMLAEVALGDASVFWRAGPRSPFGSQGPSLRGCRRHVAVAASAILLLVLAMCPRIVEASRLDRVVALGEGAQVARGRRISVGKRWFVGLGILAQLGNRGNAVAGESMRTAEQTLEDRKQDVRDALLSRRVWVGDVAELWGVVGHADVREQALRLLSDLDGSAICEALQHPDVEVRKAAIKFVTTADKPHSVQCVIFLQELLLDLDRKVRSAAYERLLELEELTVPGGIVGLYETLEDSDPFSRASGVKAFVQLGAKITDNDIQALKSMLQDEDLDVRMAAAESMTAYAGLIWGDAAGLRDASNSDNVYIRRAATASLGCLHSDAEPEDKAQLQLGLNEEDAEVPSLGCVHSDAEPEDKAQLQLGLNDEDAEVRLLATMRLISMGSLASADISITRAIIMDGDHDECLRTYAINLLAKCVGVAGAETIAALQIAFREDSAELRWAATAAFISLGVEIWPGGMDGIRQALRSDDVFVRRAASLALSDLDAGKLSSEDWQVVGEALTDVDHFVLWVVYGATHMPLLEAWTGGVEEVHQAIREGDAFERRAAVATLGALGEDIRKNDLDALIAALKDPDDFAVRWTAANALGKLGVHIGVEAHNALQDALFDEHVLVADTAAKAVERLKEMR